MDRYFRQRLTRQTSHRDIGRPFGDWITVWTSDTTAKKSRTGETVGEFAWQYWEYHDFLLQTWDFASRMRMIYFFRNFPSMMDADTLCIQPDARSRSILQPRLICGGVPSIYRWEVSRVKCQFFLVSKGEMPVFWDEPSLTWLMNKPVTTHFSSFFSWIPSPSGVGPQRRFQKPFLWNLVLKACVRMTRMTQWEHHGPLSGLGLEKTMPWQRSNPMVCKPPRLGIQLYIYIIIYRWP